MSLRPPSIDFSKWNTTQSGKSGTIYDAIWLPIQPRHNAPAPSFSIFAELMNSPPVTNKNMTLGLFRNKLLKSAAGIWSAKKEYKRCLVRLGEEAEEEFPLRPVCHVVEEFSVTLVEFTELMQAIVKGHTSSEYKDMARVALLELSQVEFLVKYNSKIYKNLLLDGERENQVDNAIAKSLLKEYEMNDIAVKEETTKLKIHELLQKLNEIISEYHQFAYDPTTMDVSELSDDLKGLLPVDDDTVTTTLMPYSTRNHIRKVTHRVYFSYNEEQVGRLLEILNIRMELARLRGFYSYKRMVIGTTIFKEPAEVKEFINLLHTGLRELARQEYSLMASIKDKFIGGIAFAIYDTEYIYKILQENISGEDSTDYTEYLSLGSVLQGIDTVFQKIFFLKLDFGLIYSGEIWSDSVYKIEISHKHFGTMCYVYLDINPSDEVGSKIFRYVVRQGRYVEDEQYISKTTYECSLMVIYLELQMSMKKDKPNVLTINEAEMLCTEFGKMAPQLIMRKKHQYILRTYSIIDFDEVAASLMRFLFYDARIMPLFYKKYPLGDSPSAETFKNIALSRRIFTACEVEKLVYRAAVDQAVYGEVIERDNFRELMTSLEKYSSVPAMRHTCVHLKSDFLSSGKTAGKYYEELYKTALEFFVWDHYYKANPLDPENSDQFWQLAYDCMLLTSPVECYKKILQTKPSPENVARILLNKVTDYYERVYPAINVILTSDLTSDTTFE